MSEILPTVEVGPENGASGSVVWLHGLGASGHDFEDIVPLLDLPKIRFVFPHAPRRPVTINMGLIMPAWYDIRSLDEDSEEDERGIRGSALLVEALIRREIERGVPPSRIVLAGFSQGGALALHVGVRYPQTLLGILVLSGYELLAGTREKEQSLANAETPILFCHGSHDPMVLRKWGHEAYETYRAQAAWQEFPMQHQVILEEIHFFAAWLHRRFESPAP